MIDILIGGIGYGLLLSIMVGPVFFMLIETSITKGIKSALYLDLGVLISDLVYVTVAFLFFQEVRSLMEGDNQYVLKVIGGAAFIVFGIVNVLKAKKSKLLPNTKLGNAEDLSANNYLMTILKGFMINALNPGVLFYWLSLMSLISVGTSELEMNQTPLPEQGVAVSQTYTQLIYITIILFTYFGIDVLKIMGAKKLKDFLTPSWIRVVNMGLGLILLLCGLLFLVQGVRALIIT